MCAETNNLSRWIDQIAAYAIPGATGPAERREAAINMIELVRFLRTSVDAMGIDDAETLASVRRALGTSESAMLRWLAEETHQQGECTLLADIVTRHHKR